MPPPPPPKKSPQYHLGGPTALYSYCKHAPPTVNTSYCRQGSSYYCKQAQLTANSAPPTVNVYIGRAAFIVRGAMFTEGRATFTVGGATFTVGGAKFTVRGDSL